MGGSNYPYPGRPEPIPCQFVIAKPHSGLTLGISPGQLDAIHAHYQQQADEAFKAGKEGREEKGEVVA
jgi:hypothetical protein